MVSAEPYASVVQWFMVIDNFTIIFSFPKPFLITAGITII